MFNSLLCFLKLCYSGYVCEGASDARIRRGQGIYDRKLLMFEVEVVSVDV